VLDEFSGVYPDFQRKPTARRFLNPDNYVQAPDFTQSYNRYSYVWNNPMKYVDPDGEFVFSFLAAIFCPPLLPLAIYFDFLTDTGYDVQKYFLPVAVKVDVSYGYYTGVGVRASFGVPQSLPFSVRGHGSAGYYWENGEVGRGWQFTYGFEVGITPYYVVGSTSYVTPGNPEFNQRTGHMRIGVPGLNLKYENDWFFGMPLGDGGDRYRTAAAKIQIGPFDVGINLFTGDPGLSSVDREYPIDPVTRKKTYIKNIKGDDPDKYRAGIGYIGLGPFRFGNDKERKRHKIQNDLIHDKVMGGWLGDPSPHFRVLETRKNKRYFQFGTGGGYLW